MTLNYKVMLEQFAQLLNEQGDYCDYGCSEDKVEEMIARARDLFPNKPCCVVGRWCWADIEFDPEHEKLINAAGFKTCFIYANRVIADEKKRWSENTCIRTTLLVEFHPPCIFSSKNTNYILCGQGVRLKVIPPVYSNFHFD
jgi:hypothetical protein